jgi:lipopolysaccharide transport system permease protein
MPNDLRVYEPHSNAGWGPSQWRAMVAELRDSRDLAWWMFRRNFVSRYRQTLFGLFGIVLEPMLLVLPFLFLERLGVLNTGDAGVPYALYALLGQSFWMLFQDGINQCGSAITSGGSMVVKINFAKETLVVAQLGQVLVNILVRLLLVAALFLWHGIAPAWTAPLALLAALPLLCLTLGVGLLLAFANALVRDLATYVRILLPFVMLMTPIMYVTPKSPAFEAFTRLNPLAHLVLAPRDLILYGRLADAHAYAAAAAGSVAVLILGWRLFHLAEARLAERLGAR